jgi:hypothetical protein
VVASTEPDDDLADYIQPIDENAPAGGAVATNPDEPGFNVPPINTSNTGQAETLTPLTPTSADSELVLQLRGELARAEARLAGREADPSNWSVAPAPRTFAKGETVLIHVRRDGFTANGRVWYQGQELEFTVGEQNYKDTLDREGNSWLQMSEADQMRRYGEVMFGHGPWPGEVWEDKRSASQEQQRGRKAPTITQITNVGSSTRV